MPDYLFQIRRCSDYSSLRFCFFDTKEIQESPTDISVPLVQTCPRPIPYLRAAPIPVVEDAKKEKRKKKQMSSVLHKSLQSDKAKKRNNTPLFVCKAVSAGSRHSLILMVDCRRTKECIKVVYRIIHT